jgi:FkbH-like protein
VIAKNLKYGEILRRNAKLKKTLPNIKYELKVLSNITVSQLNEILEYSLRVEAIPAIVKSGDYDNIVQDSLKYKDSNLVIIFWELCNIIDGLHFKIELFDDQQLDAIVGKTKSEIDLVFKNLQQSSLVLFNKFTFFQFYSSSINETKLEKLSAQLNQYLADNVPENIKLVDLEKVIANVGINSSLDLRYYYSSKALYTIDFFKAYAEHIKPYIMSANGKSKKAIIFDCDNTFWKGVLGEEGLDGIEMSSSTRDGAIFSEIQSIALAINKKGILIGLCSKNNPADVDEVIKSHPDMQLRDKHITIKKVNWLDKVTNLREIAGELNIGLDSLVFVDDSCFEVNFIKEQIPEITVLQVPDRLYDYPKMLRENLALFYNLSFTEEDKQKVGIYKQQVQRETIKKEFSDIEGYLSSLGLKLTIFEDDKSIIPRMSQMSQKTNQFNLTTKRYTEGDIRSFIANNDTRIFAFSVSDKFGDSGVTGLCIINIDGNNKVANINTLLMSCRVIGRDIEYAFMDYLIHYIKDREINMVKAKYIQTQKNEQVKGFFDKCSFSLDGSTEIEKNYVLNIEDYKPKQIHYIEVIDGR